MTAFEAELDIEALGAHGDGVARHGAASLYVPFTAPGDRVRVRLRSGQRGNQPVEARLVEVLAPGPERITAVCAHFGACGGCALQHLHQRAYTKWKAGLLADALDRTGIRPGVVEPMITVPSASRRRAELAVVRRQDGVVVGFNARGSHRVIDVTECAVLLPAIVALIDPLRPLMASLLSPGDAADIAITITDSGVDMIVTTDVRLGLTGREALADFAAEHDLARVARRHPKQEGAEVLAERRPVRVSFAGVAAPLPPGAFLQAAGEAEAALIGYVLDAALDAEKAIDLYAGIGTFALPFARAGLRVHAVDIAKQSVDALQAAARAAQLSGVTTEVRNLHRRPVPADALRRFDIVVFDPPRAGARAQAAEIAESGVARVMAVSCNPATFARDARMLVDGGYRLTRVQPIDQFLWTPHLEIAATFDRAG